MIKLTDADTRFVLPIIHPVTHERVSAETLYNDACEAMGHQIDSNIGDLVFDNLEYMSAPYNEDALCVAVFAWADSVRALINRKS